MINGEFLYKKRIEVGLSQIQVASKLGYSVQLISLWESGKNIPNITVLSKYAALLGVDLEGIIYSNDTKRNNHCDENIFDLDSFSKNIKKLRKKKGITQKELAQEISCPTNAIIRFEKGTSVPSIDQLIKLAKYFDTNIDNFYFAKDFEAPVVVKSLKRRLIPIILPIVLVVGGAGAGTGIVLINNAKKSNDGNNVVLDNSDNPQTPTTSNDNPQTSSINNDNNENINDSSTIDNNPNNSNSEQANNDSGQANNDSIFPITNKYINFGSYPQSRVTDEDVLTGLNNLSETNTLGYYEYQDNQYIKMNATYNNIYQADFDAGYYFDNNERIVEGNEYWFKVEPIEWQVLEENENEYFLLSKKVLINHEFDPSYLNNYEASSVRSWLNDGFYNQAFDGIKDKVILKEIDNSINSTSDETNPYLSNNTEDYVSLLSEIEVKNSSYNIDLLASTTEYHRANNGGSDAARNAVYWLRTPDCDDARYVKCVNTKDKVIRNYVYTPTIGVRPVIHIKK